MRLEFGWLAGWFCWLLRLAVRFWHGKWIVEDCAHVCVCGVEMLIAPLSQLIISNSRKLLDSSIRIVVLIVDVDNMVACWST